MWCLVTHSIVPLCSRLTAWIHCISVLLERGFSPSSQGTQVSWEGFRRKDEEEPSCWPSSPAGSPEALPCGLSWYRGEKPLLSLNPQKPGNACLPCKASKYLLGQGCSLSVQGSCSELSVGLAAQMLSLPLPIKQRLMDVMSSKQAFHLFGSHHLPDFFLGMILHKSMAST